MLVGYHVLVQAIKLHVQKSAGSTPKLHKSSRFSERRTPYFLFTCCLLYQDMDLMKNFKRSTARGFKIDLDRVPVQEEKQEKKKVLVNIASVYSSS
jgi:hypothetical protein